MWVPIVIVVFMMALVVGPIMWLRPTPRQRQLAGYRQRAAQLQLSVKLIPLKSLGIKDEKLSAEQDLAFYGLPWDFSNEKEKTFARDLTSSNWCIAKRAYEHEAHFLNFWDWSTEKKAARQSYPMLQTFLKTLPSDILACECSGQGVALGWLEKGEVSRVDEITALLHAFRKACLSA